VLAGWRKNPRRKKGEWIAEGKGKTRKRPIALGVQERKPKQKEIIEKAKEPCGGPSRQARRVEETEQISSTKDKIDISARRSTEKPLRGSKKGEGLLFRGN